jgi:hypothetical protein
MKSWLFPMPAFGLAFFAIHAVGMLAYISVAVISKLGWVLHTRPPRAPTCFPFPGDQGKSRWEYRRPKFESEDLFERSQCTTWHSCLNIFIFKANSYAAYCLQPSHAAHKLLYCVLAGSRQWIAYLAITRRMELHKVTWYCDQSSRWKLKQSSPCLFPFYRSFFS